MPGLTVLDDLRHGRMAQVRVTYADLHGYPRGKLIPADRLERVARDGLAFCMANLTDDLRGTPVDTPGGYPSQGYPDMHATADLDTLVRLPWDPSTGWCLADLHDGEGNPLEQAPRTALRRMLERFAARGLHPVLAPELEFYLCRPRADGSLERYVDRESMVYTIDAQSDPDGVLPAIVEAAAGLELGVLGAAHEYARSQYEVNLAHGPALDACDRAFRFKALVKEVARRHGLLATFMGRPFNDEGGSGFHLHLSLLDAEQRPCFAAAEPRTLTPLASQAIAGMLAHAPALTALCAPTVNAYKRFQPGMLAPTHAVWGHDNRTLYVRVPAEGGAASRVEFRGGDGSANPYVLATAVLGAVLRGIEQDPPLPPQSGGDQSFSTDGPALPSSLGSALDALEADEALRGVVGQALVRDFLIVKRFELQRFSAYVTDWELTEYAHHL